MPPPTTPTGAPQQQLFNIVQDEDTRTETELEGRLYQTSMNLYTGTAQTQEGMEMPLSYTDLCYRVIGTLKFARDLLMKYTDASPKVEDLTEDLKTAIDEIRNKVIQTEKKELLIEIYEKNEDEIREILGPVLGWRKRRQPKYKWTEKVAERMQITIPDELKKDLKKNLN